MMLKGLLIWGAWCPLQPIKRYPLVLTAMPKTTKKFYAVSRGRRTGIFTSWKECEAQVKGFTNARFKGFKTLSEAQQFIGGGTATGAEWQRARPPQLKTKNPTANRHTVPKTHSTDENCGLSIVIHFDGGSRGNPGLAGSGAEVAVKERGQEDERGNDKERKIHIRKYLGTRATNNVAEYEGLLCGLNHAQSIVREYFQTSASQTDPAARRQSVHVKVYGDSDLLIKQLNGIYKCKNKKLIPLYEQAMSLVGDLQKTANAVVSFQHVYREDNKIADGLANEAMDSRKSWTTTVMENAEEHEDDAEKVKRTSEV